MFVSLLQNRSSGSEPSGAGPASSSSAPTSGWLISIVAPAPAFSSGRTSVGSQAHVLRNQTVGSTCSVSAAGPAFVTRTR